PCHLCKGKASTPRSLRRTVAGAPPPPIFADGNLPGTTDPARLEGRRWYGMVIAPPRSGGWAGDPVPFAVPWSCALGLTGLLTQTEAELEKAYRWALEVGSPENQARCAALLGRASLSRGRVHRAGHFLREAVASTRASDH